MRPVPLVGELKEGRGSCMWGNSLTGGEISWDRRGALGAIGGDPNNQSVAGRTE